MFLCRKQVGTTQQIEVCLSVVSRDFFDDVFDPNHQLRQKYNKKNLKELFPQRRKDAKENRYPLRLCAFAGNLLRLFNPSAERLTSSLPLPFASDSRHSVRWCASERPRIPSGTELSVPSGHPSQPAWTPRAKGSSCMTRPIHCLNQT